MFKVFSQRLYLRIWLAVVGGVAVLTLVVGWAWRVAEEYNASNNAQQTNNARELVIRDGQGQILLQGPFERIRRPGADGVVFNIEGTDGQTYHLEMAPRAQPGGGNPRERAGGGRPPPGHGGQDWAFWLRPPFGFLWLLGLIGLVVVVGVFPIIRRLLKRLENLQRGVQRFGEGDLSVRVPTEGRDEVADLARQFNAAAGRIEALVQSHKSLLANASHELRSPLARIRMGLELMGGQTPSPTFRAEILRNIAELDQLVDEILLASRLDAREADVGTVEDVDLIGLAAEECARVDADLDVSAVPEGLEVRGISKLLRRAIRNLLENARRYSTGEITVQVLRSGTLAEVRVCDRGPGVPLDQRERIFEPFYRLPGASERSGGVGLGLALVRSIAGRHNGSVHCEDHVGGGACFVLRLPLALTK